MNIEWPLLSLVVDYWTVIVFLLACKQHFYVAVKRGEDFFIALCSVG